MLKAINEGAKKMAQELGAPTACGEFRSQHPLGDSPLPLTQLQGIQHPLLVFFGTVFIHIVTYKDTYIYT